MWHAEKNFFPHSYGSRGCVDCWRNSGVLRWPYFSSVNRQPIFAVIENASVLHAFAGIYKCATERNGSCSSCNFSFRPYMPYTFESALYTIPTDPRYFDMAHRTSGPRVGKSVCVVLPLLLLDYSSRTRFHSVRLLSATQITEIAKPPVVFGWSRQLVQTVKR